jgi:hypothetical protein
MGRAAARVVFPVENAVSGLGRALEVATSLTPAGWPGPRTLGFRFRDSSLQIRREPFVRFSLFQEPRLQRCCRRDGEQGNR